MKGMFMFPESPIYLEDSEYLSDLKILFNLNYEKCQLHV